MYKLNNLHFNYTVNLQTHLRGTRLYPMKQSLPKEISYQPIHQGHPTSPTTLLEERCLFSLVWMKLGSQGTLFSDWKYLCSTQT